MIKFGDPYVKQQSILNIVQCYCLAKNSSVDIIAEASDRNTYCGGFPCAGGNTHSLALYTTHDLACTLVSVDNSVQSSRGSEWYGDLDP